MTRSNFTFRAAFFALIATLFAAPLHSFADTYQLVDLGIDNTQFYGMTNSGAVVLYASWFNCGNPATGCYETFQNGVNTGDTDVAPVDTWNYSSGICTGPTQGSPCTITDNGRTAEIAAEPELEGLYADSGSNPPQLLLTTGFGGIFAMDGSGDIVFDNGSLDEWEEAIDTTTPTIAPEPSSLILLLTGILGLTFGHLAYSRMARAKRIAA